MKKPFLLFILFLCYSISFAQEKKVAIVSFYLDEKIDFSMMQSFSDFSEDKVQKMVDHPDFDLSPLIVEMHEYLLSKGEELPFEFLDVKKVQSAETYSKLEKNRSTEKTETYLPYEGYKQVGLIINDAAQDLVKDLDADGYLCSEIVFYVRKNLLETVIQAQLKMTIYNAEGKRAWSYSEFGISEDGIKTLAGVVIEKKDEVYPMFSTAIDNLKEKMDENFAEKAVKSTKKL